MPGVRIEDMGHKMGCNGVDNGKLWFDGTHSSFACIVESCALMPELSPVHCSCIAVYCNRSALTHDQACPCNTYCNYVAAASVCHTSYLSGRQTTLCPRDTRLSEGRDMLHWRTQHM